MSLAIGVGIGTSFGSTPLTSYVDRIADLGGGNIYGLWRLDSPSYPTGGKEYDVFGSGRWVTYNAGFSFADRAFLTGDMAVKTSGSLFTDLRFAETANPGTAPHLNYTLGVWAYLPDTNQRYLIVYDTTDSVVYSESHWQRDLSNNSQLNWNTNPPEVTSSSSYAETWTVTQWNHYGIVVANDGLSADFYINGVYYQTDTTPAAPVAPTITTGLLGASGPFAVASIWFSHLILYSQALTPAEMAKLGSV